MPLPLDARLGPYQLLGLLGAGGMGEVYKACDTRLDRLVAVKIVRADLAADVERSERLRREARAVAALNRPHICALHDVGEFALSGIPGAAPSGDSAVDQEGGDQGPIRFLVMEYLEGQTLADRLLRGPLPPADVIRYASEIADALDHAHRRGFVHRDLKPGNVMLTRTGAKLLDFGLSRAQSKPDILALSTIATGAPPLTAAGAVLGTFPYMAPEQLGGRECDARSDIFAFGAVLYEMATGRRAFAGTTAATVIGAVLHADPPSLASLEVLAPAGLQRTISRCLAKDPEDRWQTARDLTLELKWIGEQQASPVIEPSASAKERIKGATRVRRAGLAAAAVSLIAGVTGGAALYLYWRPVTASLLTTRLTFVPPQSLTVSEVRLVGPVTISPDGRRFAYVAAAADGRQLLRVQPLDSATPQALAGSEGASYPFWSPDSRFVAFFAQGKLKRIDPAVGPPQTVCDATQPRGGTWSTAGTIVFAANAGQQLYRVPAAGGTAVPLRLAQPNRETYSPSFLPDGDHFLFFGRRQASGLYVASLASSSAKRLVAAEYVGAVYAAGHLLILKGGALAGTLLAQPFDLRRLELTGDATPFAEDVAFYPSPGRADFSSSETGTLIYGTRGQQTTQLAWFDRGGRLIERVAGGGGYQRPALSPDEKTIAADRVDPDAQSPDIWLIESQGGVTTRVTSNPAFEGYAVWSPDGRRIVFGSGRDGGGGLYQRETRGSAREQLAFKVTSENLPVIRQETDWSADGRFIVYAGLDPKTKWDLWLLPAEARAGGPDRTPIPYLQTDFNEHHAQLSPNGRWMAYASDESGLQEIYVAAFPHPNGRTKISIGGGIQPRWGRDGTELFYLAPDGSLIAVQVPAAQSDPMFKAAGSTPLFRTRNAYASSDLQPWMPYYIPAAGGQRFLMNIAEETIAPSMSVVLNWPATLSGR